MKHRICIIGSGYVGLVTGTCLAELGNNVICVDNNEKKINQLKKRKLPFYEPGLDKLIGKNRKRIKFTTSIKEGVLNSEIIFICVGTPPNEDGSANLSDVERVATVIASNIKGYKLIVEKSTVPVDTGEWVKLTISRNLTNKVHFDVASNPEFLREGQAINDFFHPDRIVIGVESKKAEEILKDVYKPIKAPVIVTDRKSAELIKHASNSFLAMKISFINAVANICEHVGADVTKIAQGMGFDKRIGKSFLSAGIGFGGSCFPKDLDAFCWIAKKLGYNFELLDAVRKINREQRENIVKKIEDALWVLHGKTIAILGLSFKPDTDDMRSAPSIDIIKILHSKGAKIKAYDPRATERAKEILPFVKYARNPYDACKQADCAVLVTEWDEFKNIDFKKLKKSMKQPVIIDGRNFYDPDKLIKLGFVYRGVGRY